jgi:hypothetical protein
VRLRRALADGGGERERTRHPEHLRLARGGVGGLDVRHERHAVSALALGAVQAAVGRLDDVVDVGAGAGAHGADRDRELQVQAVHDDRRGCHRGAEALGARGEVGVRADAA